MSDHAGNGHETHQLTSDTMVDAELSCPGCGAVIRARAHYGCEDAEHARQLDAVLDVVVRQRDALDVDLKRAWTDLAEAREKLVERRYSFSAGVLIGAVSFSFISFTAIAIWLGLL